MQLDKFKETFKIHYKKLKTNHNYVKVTAFLFIGVQLFDQLYNAVIKDNFHNHPYLYSTAVVALSASIYFKHKEVQRRLKSKQYLDAKEEAAHNYQAYKEVEDIHSEKKQLENMIAPIPNIASSPRLVGATDIPKPKKQKI